MMRGRWIYCVNCNNLGMVDEFSVKMPKKIRKNKSGENRRRNKISLMFLDLKMLRER